MKTITFTEQELEFLRDQYEFELEEAENYVESIKSILLKLGTARPVKSAEIFPAEKKSRQKGKKPTLVKVEKKSTAEVIKIEPAAKTYTGKKRGRKPRIVKTEEKAVPVELVIKERKIRADKGKKRNKQTNITTRQEKIAEVITSLAQGASQQAELVKAAVPKKKTGKNKIKRKGITLTNLKKSLP